jgi:hypothetical protein
VRVRELLFEQLLQEAKTDYVVKTFGEKLVMAARQNDKDFWKKITKGVKNPEEQATQLAERIVTELLKVDPKTAELDELVKKQEHLQKEIDVLTKKAAAHNDDSKVNQAALDLVPKQRELNKVVQKLSAPADKYLVWIARMYAVQQFKMEDVPRIRGEVIKFEKVKGQLEKKDLNGYKTLNDLYDALDAIPLDGEEKKKEEEPEKEEGVEWIIRSPKYKVLIAKTEEASCKYGAGTRWCTAATGSSNYFKHYATQDDLYIIMADIDGKHRKFQFHFKTKSFMDERDQRATKEDIKGLSEHPEHLKFVKLLVARYADN